MTREYIESKNYTHFENVIADRSTSLKNAINKIYNFVKQHEAKPNKKFIPGHSFQIYVHTLNIHLDSIQNEECGILFEQDENNISYLKKLIEISGFDMYGDEKDGVEKENKKTEHFKKFENILALKNGENLFDHEEFDDLVKTLTNKNDTKKVSANNSDIETQPNCLQRFCNTIFCRTR